MFPHVSGPVLAGLRKSNATFALPRVEGNGYGTPIPSPHLFVHAKHGSVMTGEGMGEEQTLAPSPGAAPHPALSP